MKHEIVHLRTRKLPSGIITYYLDYKLNGKRKFEALGLFLYDENTPQMRAQNQATTRAAERIKSQKIIELTGIMCGAPVYPKILVYDFLLRVHHSLYQFAPALVKQLKAYTKNRDLYLSDIDEDFLRGFSKFLANKSGLHHSAPKEYFAKFTQVLNHAVRLKLIPENPARYLSAADKPKGRIKEREYLTPEEVQILIKTETKYKAITNAFLFACFTGLRRSDVYAMKWEHIERTNGKMFLRYTQVKTGKYEVLPISEAAQKFLPLEQDKGEVFPYYCGTSICDALRRWTEQAGITKHITFHSSRHTFATLTLNAGADIYTVSKLLGHSRVTTTQIYAQIIDKKKEEAVNLLNDIAL